MSEFQQENFEEPEQESEQQEPFEGTVPETQQQEPFGVQELLSTAEKGASTKKQGGGFNWLIILAIIAILAAAAYYYFFIYSKESCSVDGSDLPMSADAFDISSGGATTVSE